MNFSGPELLIVFLIILIIFGAGKLPQVFSSLGKGVREFRDASEGREVPPTTTTSSTTTAAGTPTTSTTTTEEVKRNA